MQLAYHNLVMGHICAEMPFNTLIHLDKIFTGLESRKWNHY